MTRVKGEVVKWSFVWETGYKARSGCYAMVPWMTTVPVVDSAWPQQLSYYLGCRLLRRVH